MINMMIYLFIILIGSSKLLYADCQKTTNIIKSKLFKNRANNNLDLFDCKIWPYDPNKTIIVFGNYVGEKKGAPDISFHDLDVIVADSNSGKILAYNHEEKAICSGAISVYSIALDTGKYQLNSTIRGFGVRFNFRNFSTYNPYRSTALNLYYIKGSTLETPIKNVIVREEDGDYDVNCKGNGKEFERTISLGKVGAMGFRKLIIKTTLKEITLHNNGTEDCQDVVKQKIYSRFINFNGKKYVIPKEYLNYDLCE